MTAAVFLNFAVRFQQDNVARVQRFGLEFLSFCFALVFGGLFFCFVFFLSRTNYSVV